MFRSHSDVMQQHNASDTLIDTPLFATYVYCDNYAGELAQVLRQHGLPSTLKTNASVRLFHVDLEWDDYFATASFATKQQLLHQLLSLVGQFSLPAFTPLYVMRVTKETGGYKMWCIPETNTLPPSINTPLTNFTPTLLSEQRDNIVVYELAGALSIVIPLMSLTTVTTNHLIELESATTVDDKLRVVATPLLAWLQHDSKMTAERDMGIRVATDPTIVAAKQAAATRTEELAVKINQIDTDVQQLLASSSDDLSARTLSQEDNRHLLQQATSLKQKTEQMVQLQHDAVNAQTQVLEEKVQDMANAANEKMLAVEIVAIKESILQPLITTITDFCYLPRVVSQPQFFQRLQSLFNEDGTAALVSVEALVQHIAANGMSLQSLLDKINKIFSYQAHLPQKESLDFSNRLRANLVEAVESSPVLVIEKLAGTLMRYYPATVLEQIRQDHASRTQSDYHLLLDKLNVVGRADDSVMEFHEVLKKLSTRFENEKRSLDQLHGFCTSLNKYVSVCVGLIDTAARNADGLIADYEASIKKTIPALLPEDIAAHRKTLQSARAELRQAVVDIQARLGRIANTSIALQKYDARVELMSVLQHRLEINKRKIDDYMQAIEAATQTMMCVTEPLFQHQKQLNHLSQEVFDTVRAIVMQMEFWQRSAGGDEVELNGATFRVSGRVAPLVRELLQLEHVVSPLPLARLNQLLHACQFTAKSPTRAGWLGSLVKRHGLTTLDDTKTTNTFFAIVESLQNIERLSRDAMLKQLQKTLHKLEAFAKTNHLTLQTKTTTKSNDKKSTRTKMIDEEVVKPTKFLTRRR